MVKTDIKAQLRLIETGLSEAKGIMEPLVRESLISTDNLLSRVLLVTLTLGSIKTDKKTISACQSLEILDQALRLGETRPANSDERDKNLLIGDYLFAQAINQVTSINEPVIIDCLAKAISGSAEDRVSGTQRHYRYHLFGAALDIALHLGDFTEKHKTAIRAAKTRSLETFPDAPEEEYLRETINPGAVE
ncbi:MAG TPA: hypothetical protein ENI11_02425 [Actinobacteria bacterium]|nr:hypothetical protein [Actinomycetota bacterium]